MWGRFGEQLREAFGKFWRCVWIASGTLTTFFATDIRNYFRMFLILFSTFVGGQKKNTHQHHSLIALLISS